MRKYVAKENHIFFFNCRAGYFTVTKINWRQIKNENG